MPQPCTEVSIRAEGRPIPEEITLSNPGPDPAMATIKGVGVVSAFVDDDGFWKAHLVSVADGGTSPDDLFVQVNNGDIEAELVPLDEAGPGNSLVVVFKGLAGGGPTRAMVSQVLSDVLMHDQMAMWWSTPNPALENQVPGVAMDGAPERVYAAAKDYARAMLARMSAD